MVFLTSDPSGLRAASIWSISSPQRIAQRFLNDIHLPDGKKTLTIVEIGKFKAMCGGDANWEKPSSIRNRWNYRDAAYFNETGFNSAQPFLKLLNDKHAASQWIVNQSTIRNENEKIASLAAITQFLSSALDESYNYGFLTLLVRNE
jgi:hypothetical protein